LLASAGHKEDPRAVWPLAVWELSRNFLSPRFVTEAPEAIKSQVQKIVPT